MSIQGLTTEVLKRKGKCVCCEREILSGTKTVVLGSYSNKYRYCLECFSYEINSGFEVIVSNELGVELK